MTVGEQLESFAAHNAYHFGRIVLLRQMLGSWPPPSDGLTWQLRFLPPQEAISTQSSPLASSVEENTPISTPGYPDL